MHGCALLTEERVDELRRESLEKGADFYTHVAASVLKCEPDRVSNLARNEAKVALFMYQYSSSAAKLTRKVRESGLKASQLVVGQKYNYEGKMYEFAYIGGTGKAIIHPEGEPDMQSSMAVDPEELSTDPPGPRTRFERIR